MQLARRRPDPAEPPFTGSASTVPTARAGQRGRGATFSASRRTSGLARRSRFRRRRRESEKVHREQKKTEGACGAGLPRDPGPRGGGTPGSRDGTAARGRRCAIEGRPAAETISTRHQNWNPVGQRRRSKSGTGGPPKAGPWGALLWLPKKGGLGNHTATKLPFWKRTARTAAQPTMSASTGRPRASCAYPETSSSPRSR